MSSTLAATLLGQFLPLILLLIVAWKGTLRRSPRYLLPVLLAGAGLVIGLLFRLQHWEGAVGILLGSATVLLGCYGALFARKPTKTRLDWLKLALVAALGSWGIALAFAGPNVVRGFSSLLTVALWAVVLDFGYVTFLRRPTNPPAAAGSAAPR
ncbi:hypothetical protein E5K00_06735 [Hymenobacter aquaticus]|uniref:Uncharacterized protein n=1 Tax=Hymenobacter aquaticus TaxID=1867101 RepID=A0A4Z0Q771_9BACT|nr:hypothetical protein [Hymenobacter aquaticus]TGE24891.1 hypothetical protein E5K00_06735 [Hymenobacter aquaticus]